MEAITTVADVVLAHGQALRIPEHHVSPTVHLVAGDGHVVAIPDANGVATPGHGQVLTVDDVLLDPAAVSFAQVDAEKRLFKAVAGNRHVFCLDDDARVFLVQRIAAAADEKATQGDVWGDHFDYSALVLTVNHGPVMADQSEGPVNLQGSRQRAPVHLEGSARRRRSNGCRQLLGADHSALGPDPACWGAQQQAHSYHQ